MKEVIHTPKAAILYGPGTNRWDDTRYAFEKAGAKAEGVLLDALRRQEHHLSEYQIVVFPGGFSFGDHIRSGRIAALYLRTHLADQIEEYIAKGGLVYGECNGFQVLTASGLLSDGTLGNVNTALMPNASGSFECRPVHMRVEDENACVFLEGMNGQTVMYQAAHGEGRFHTSAEQLAQIEANNQVIMRYCTPDGTPTQEYPFNPNGSVNAIAGICDPSGRILGMMPHPTVAMEPWHHPNWRRGDESQGMPLFQRMVGYAAQM